MTNSPVNQKSFTLVNKVSKNFSVIIANFAYAATLLFRIKDKIRIFYLPSFYVNFIYTLTVKKVRLTISQVKLRVKIVQTINAKRVRIIANIKERLKAASIIYGRVRIGFVSTARQKIVSSIIIRKIVLNMSPVLAQFYTLGYFDPQTLGTLDLLTLGEMDYTTS